MQRSIDCTHLNPVRAGLVMHGTDWRRSSAQFYAYEMGVPIVMDRIGDPHGSGRRGDR